MGEVIELAPSLTAADKQRLIHEAHEQLVAAREIDERETLGNAEAVAWYDAVIPEVTDVEVIAGAMRAELAIRRGKLIQQEGELRGAEPGFNNKEVKSSAPPNFRHDQRRQRSEDRLIAKQEHAVREYVKDSVKLKKPPTRRGMLRAAIRAKDPSKAERQPGSQARKGDAIQALILLAEQGKPVTREEIEEQTSVHMDTVIKAAMYLPWVTYTRDTGRYHFVIDQELKDICDGRRPRPVPADSAGEPSNIVQLLRTLNEEINRQRKEYSIERKKVRWDYAPARVKFIVRLLDYVQAELNKVINTDN